MGSKGRVDVQHLRRCTYEHLVQSADVMRQAAEGCLDSILDVANLIIGGFQNGNKVLICGNGGSAADAQHMAAEFMNRLNRDVERPGLPAIALTTDTSFLTSYANDIGFEGVFERQVLALGNSGDILIAISTSGDSKNVVKSVAAAHEKRLRTVGLLGEGGALTALVDRSVVVPSRDTQHVQECLLAIEHTICHVVERTLFG